MKKLRKQAKDLLHAASKVYHYRRDVTSVARLQELEKTVGEIESMLKDTSTEKAPFEAAMKRLDALLRKIGGKIYPKTFWSDNLEVILVAAILVIGVRTFFFQPFIIPTNSMYPTYSGMNTVVYAADEASPNAVEKVFNKITLGANHKSLIAEASGPVSLVLLPNPKTGKVGTSRPVPYRKYFVLPAQRAEYVFSVGGTLHSIQVPAEFDMLSAVRQFFPDANLAMAVPSQDSPSGQALQLNHSVAAGDPIMRFDITLGDALFVDRISYHFKRPKAGDPFVFRTNAIREELGRLTGDYTDKYYIKRIGGVGGETLEIVDSTLLVDGQPRDEVEAFGRNAAREGEYSGYINHTLLAEGRKLKIPDDKFVALGDNSANSLDSRYWGFVPEKSVIGKAIFIYYPFTKRWGVAE
ncbi:MULTISPECIES: signal peptidase I [unclassified Lentimonas]|uniref:signal peptidase I n=1 Tax=unclassified Lentimonas TaxID=2630993 RepID=UPI00132339E4|nr:MULTISPECIES: signal peptidase I [unclassified Lentimonas]CAA6678233.1 Signal peptidase I (EC [Lentimonas sp. CC4]CAA6684871.1 Signal peptidase I (EC [Lentimonas sp. CC6]CAA6689791.1 Signal peptidase I (EC [Lentimonas sp. CC19]CAA6690655.1 Signal peptidase I (EC [Lentimonas sp. CC10]CAA7068909.1 Signal peptidase I (EC [Lentimonas sp. CC11]